jgi:ribosomal protein L3 glutamine methyltransferase
LILVYSTSSAVQDILLLYNTKASMFTQAETQLHTFRDLLRFAVSRFNEAGLFFGHGSTSAYDEAAYLILHTLHFWMRVSPALN